MSSPMPRIIHISDPHFGREMIDSDPPARTIVGGKKEISFSVAGLFDISLAPKPLYSCVVDSARHDTVANFLIDHRYDLERQHRGHHRRSD